MKLSTGKTYAPSLVQATYESYNKQVLPYRFLSPLTNRKQTSQNNTVRLHGPHQDATIIVEYVARNHNELRLKGDDNGVANAFTGSQWSTFVSQNDIEQDFWLLFEKNKSNPADLQGFHIQQKPNLIMD